MCNIMSISCLKVFDKVCYFLTGNLPVNNVIYSLQKLNISSLDGLTSHSERKPPASSHSKTVNYILAIELFFFIKDLVPNYILLIYLIIEP